MKKVNIIFLISLIISLNWSCNFGKVADSVSEGISSLDEGIAVLDEGIEKITNESSSWRATLEEVYDELPEDLDDAKENISQLIAEGLGMASSNSVCIIDAIPKRTIRALNVLKANLKEETIPILEPTVCQTSLAVIDLNQPVFLRDKIIVYGYDFKEDSYLSLSLKTGSGGEYALTDRLFKLSDYQYSIVLSDMDNLMENGISVVLRFDDEIISEFAIIQQNIPDPVLQTFSINDTDKLFPLHIEGDRDFGGNGPYASTSASIKIVNQKEIWLKVRYYVRETQSDWSTAEGEWNYKVYTAIGDKKILSIESATSSQASYVDNDHSVDIPAITGGLVSQFLCKGDTSGNDIGNNTDDDSYLIVKFNPVTIIIQ